MGEFVVHRSQANIDLAYGRVEKDAAVCAKNKQLIFSFSRDRLAKGVGRMRMTKCIYCLRFMARWHKTPFDKATKDSLMQLVNMVDAQPYAPASKHDFKTILKMFFKWLKGNDEAFPPEISWLKPRLKNKHKLPEELLTEEEVFKLAKAADNPRDRAFVLVLYETGCRIGELLTLKMKNVQFDQYGAVLRVTGKTGDRRVRIISSAPALSSWVGIHAKAEDPEAPLWPPLSTGYKYHQQSLGYESLYLMLKELANRAGVRKKIYPHLFRHSRATALAGKLTEAQMKEYFGWVQASDMASVYVHLSGRNVDDAMLALQGLKKPESDKEDTLKLCFCPRCKEKNSPIAKFCLRCGSPMQTQTMMEVEHERQVGDEVLNKLMQKQEFKDLMFKMAVELGLDKKL